MPEPGPDPWLGQRFRHWRAVQRVSTGPLARVYRATSELADGFYALKVFPLDAAIDELRIRAFLEAARLRTMTRHPALLPAVEAGREPGCLFLVLEWVDAGPLTARVRSGRSVPADAALRWARTLAESLSALHVQGLPHRALHPANLLLAVDGNLRLADIGLGRILRPETARDGGDPECDPARFLAPEERAAARPPVGEKPLRANLYSLGATLWYLLAGREPGDPPLPTPDSPGGTPDYLLRIVEELARPEPERRPASAETVVRWLQARKAEPWHPQQPPAPPTASGSAVEGAPVAPAPSTRRPTAAMLVPGASAGDATAAAPARSGGSEPAAGAGDAAAAGSVASVGSAPTPGPGSTRRPTASVPAPTRKAAADRASTPAPSGSLAPAPGAASTRRPTTATPSAKPKGKPILPPHVPAGPLPDGSRRLPTLLEQGRLPLPIALSVIQESLEHLRQSGRVHGDVHPGRIVLDPQGRARLIEYGETPAAFSLSHLAPERASGAQQEPDAAVDLYALAAILYELATGRRPYGGETEEEFREAMARGEPTPVREHDPGLTPDLEAVLAKALARARARRYADAAAFAADLAALQDARPTVASAELPAATRLARRWPRLARKAGLVAAGAIGVALLLAAASALLDLRDTRRQDEAAEVARRARLEADERADRLLRDARSLAEAGEWGLADRIAESALSEAPESALADEVRLFLGDATARAGDPARALRHLGAVYGADPGSPAGRQALVGIAAALLRDRRFSAARAACDRVLAEKPEGSESRRAELVLADLLAAEHRWPEAAQLYEEIARGAGAGTTASAPDDPAREAARARRWLRLLGAPRRIEAPGLRIAGTAPALIVALRPNEVSVYDALPPAAPRAIWRAAEGDAFLPSAARIADLDTDGNPEVIVATTGITVFRLDQGTLRPAVAERVGSRVLPQGLAVGDADNDGRPDVALGLASPDRRCLFYRVGTGLTLELAGGYSLPDRPSGDVTAVAIGDWTGDGRNEVAIAFAPCESTPDGELRVLEFSPGFENPRLLWKLRAGAIASIAAVDLDGDRRVELALAARPPGPRRGSPLPGGFLLAQAWREERFRLVTALPAPGSNDTAMLAPAPAATLDLDADGQPEALALWGERRGGTVLATLQLAWWESNRWEARTLVLDEVSEATFLPGVGTADLNADGRPEVILSTGAAWWCLGGAK